MKTIIAGSRDVTDYNLVVEAVKESGFEITEVVSGTARGADRLGEQYAAEHELPVKKFPAQWMNRGRMNKAAGVIRNNKMACYADALIAIWDGTSSGTKNMIKQAEKQGLKVYVKRYTT